MMLQEWRKSWTLKGLSMPDPRISFTLCLFLPSRPASVQHFKSLASSPSLWQQHHCVPKNQVPFHECIIDFVSILWISTPMNLFTWILHETTPATLILGREPHGSRCLSTLPQLPSCLLLLKQNYNPYPQVQPRGGLSQVLQHTPKSAMGILAASESFHWH